MELKIFLTGLFCFFLLLIAIFLMAYVIVQVGKRKLLKDYNKSFKTLEMLVRNNTGMTPTVYQYIKGKFTEIEKFACRDKHKLLELHNEFEAKYFNQHKPGQEIK